MKIPLFFFLTKDCYFDLVKEPEHIGGLGVSSLVSDGLPFSLLNVEMPYFVSVELYLSFVLCSSCVLVVSL